MNSKENVVTPVNYYFAPETYEAQKTFQTSQIMLESEIQTWTNKLCRPRAPEILFCITVYNEPAPALLYSLAGIKRNIDYLVKIGKRFIAEKIAICLIFDGQKKMSASASALLEALKLYTSGRVELEAAMHIFDSHLNLELVEKCVSADAVDSKVNNHWWNVHQFALQQDDIAELEPTHSVSPRVLLCIKQENTGKLNSHWWFLKFLSTYLRPKYCVQMDVGSIPQSHSAHEIWRFLEMHPNVGAVAGSILVPEPRRFWYLLSIWQFGCFYLDKLLFLPAEDITGYVSVLPGQFSVLRWQALTANLEKKTSSMQQTSPLDKYFRGLKPSGAFEATMFLTEDRILGLEIATHISSKWRLAYLSTAVAITDSCQSLTELLHQRRRWINGSLACQILSIVRILQYLSEEKVDVARKLRFLVSVPLYILKALTVWFYPSLLILVRALICKTLKHLSIDLPQSQQLIDLLFDGGVLLLVAQILLCQFAILHKPLLVANIAYGSLFLLFALVVLVGKGYYLPAILLALLFLIAYGIAKVHLPGIAKRFWRNIPLYIAINSAYTCLLNSYAFFNINDRSWGTKGLIRERAQKHFHWYYVLLWLLSNLALLLTAFSFQSSILIFVLVGYLDLLIGLGAGALAAIAIFRQRHSTEKLI